MAKSKTTIRAIKRAMYQDVIRLSSTLTFLREFLKRNHTIKDKYWADIQIFPERFYPALKDYKNMIIDKTTNLESSLDCVIIPGSEYHLPTNIHPKEIRLVTLSGYNSNTKPGDEEFEEWYSSFDSCAIHEWVEEVIDRNKRQKRYRRRSTSSHLHEYQTDYQYDSRDKGEPGCCCLQCRSKSAAELAHHKHRKNQNLRIRIDNDINSMYYDRYTGKKEFKTNKVY
jgi:hypothetical protein